MNTLTVKGLLAATLGCVFEMESKGLTLENGNFKPERDCLMHSERESLLNIENAMVDKLKRVLFLKYTRFILKIDYSFIVVEWE